MKGDKVKYVSSGNVVNMTLEGFRNKSKIYWGVFGLNSAGLSAVFAILKSSSLQIKYSALFFLFGIVLILRCLCVNGNALNKYRNGLICSEVDDEETEKEYLTEGSCCVKRANIFFVLSIALFLVGCVFTMIGL